MDKDIEIVICNMTAIYFVLNLKWFKQIGLISLDSFTERNLKFIFPLIEEPLTRPV